MSQTMTLKLGLDPIDHTVSFQFLITVLNLFNIRPNITYFNTSINGGHEAVRVTSQDSDSSLGP